MSEINEYEELSQIHKSEHSYINVKQISFMRQKAKENGTDIQTSG